MAIRVKATHRPPIALAGNRAVNMHASENLIRAVLYGGYAPSTAQNPRPFGMPPFSHTLNDIEVAEVLSFVRSAWGNDAAAVRRAGCRCKPHRAAVVVRVA